MKLSKEGADLIQHFEGLRLEAYKCAADVWTIGWGHTKTVKPGDKITRARAVELFNQDIKVFEDGVNRLVTVNISQSLFDALVSLSFNIGLANFSKSTLLKVVNRRAPWSEVAPQIRRWVFGGGRRLNGLVRRREAEVLLAAGLPWRTKGTTTDQDERDETHMYSVGSVEAEWIRHENEANRPVTNTTVLGSTVAVVGTAVTTAFEFIKDSPDVAAEAVKTTAEQVQEYQPFVPVVEYGVSALMIVSLLFVIYSRVKKLAEAKY